MRPRNRGHHMVNTEIRLIIFSAAKDGKALYSQQKHGEGERVLALESQERTRASRRVEEPRAAFREASPSPQGALRWSEGA